MSDAVRTARTSLRSCRQPLDGVENPVAGHGYAGHAVEDRPQRAYEAPLDREHPLDVAPERLGQREQAQRLGRRGAVDGHEVPSVRAHLVADLEQRQHLLGAGQDRQLLRPDRVDTHGVEDLEQVAGDVVPAALEAAAGVDLLGEQAGGDLGRLTGEQGYVASPGTECVAERVGRIRRQDKGLQAAGGSERSSTRQRSSSCRRHPCP